MVLEGGGPEQTHKHPSLRERTSLCDHDHIDEDERENLCIDTPQLNATAAPTCPKCPLEASRAVVRHAMTRTRGRAIALKID